MNDSNQHIPTDADREVEAALASLRPAHCGASRDELMFEAGRRSTWPSVSRWKGVAAMLALSSGVLLIWPRSQSVTPTVATDIHPATIPMPGSTLTAPVQEMQFAYLQLRDRVLAGGVDALPPTEVTESPSTPSLQRLLSE